MIDPKAPTRTEDWLRCPVYAAYTQRWERAGGWTPHRVLGNAIAAGLAAHRTGRGLIHVKNEASRVLTHEFVEQDEWTFEGVGQLVDKGLAAAVQTDLGPVIAVEQWMGHARIDAVSRLPGTGLVVTDDKVHLELERKYLPSRLKEWDVSHQLHHEAWAASAHYGEPVAYARVHIIVLTPRVWVYEHLVPMGADKLDAWLASAETTWQAMDGPPYRNPNACTKYGGCAFQAGCWTLHGDETRFPTLYTPKGGTQ